MREGEDYRALNIFQAVLNDFHVLYYFNALTHNNYMEVDAIITKIKVL